MAIKKNDLADFERDGFLVIRQLFSAQEINDLSETINEITSHAPVPGKEMFYYEDSLLKPGERILSRIEKFCDTNERLRVFVTDKRIIGNSSELLKGPAVLFKEKINFKLPGGDGFKPHQDIQPGWDDYADYFISVLVTIDESTLKNGCLELAAGHHKRGLIGRKWKPLEGQELDGMSFKKFPMAPGDVAFFDCFVPHQSGPNLTDKSRRNLYLTFNREISGNHREKYFADKRKSYPPDNEREPGKKYTFKV